MAGLMPEPWEVRLHVGGGRGYTIIADEPFDGRLPNPSATIVIRPSQLQPEHRVMTVFAGQPLEVTYQGKRWVYVVHAVDPEAGLVHARWPD